MRLFALTLLASVYASAAWAAMSFPQLSGRVVDNAQILSPATQQSLETNLAAHEQTTTVQIVVVTLTSLQGYTIEEYGYQLGRHWGIGQIGKNNGVLLIVAPKERQVRIEVGYGLEGILTDTVTSQIIQTIMLPNFKKGMMEKGVLEGTTAIMSVLSGTPLKPAQSIPGKNIIGLGFGLFVLLTLYGFYRLMRAVHRFHNRLKNDPELRETVRALTEDGNDTGGNSGGSNGGGGGFSGGGGSFGGGGSSGRW